MKGGRAVAALALAVALLAWSCGGGGDGGGGEGVNTLPTGAEAEDGEEREGSQRWDVDPCDLVTEAVAEAAAGGADLAEPKSVTRGPFRSCEFSAVEPGSLTMVVVQVLQQSADRNYLEQYAAGGTVPVGGVTIPEFEPVEDLGDGAVHREGILAVLDGDVFLQISVSPRQPLGVLVTLARAVLERL